MSEPLLGTQDEVDDMDQLVAQLDHIFVSQKRCLGDGIAAFGAILANNAADPDQLNEMVKDLGEIAHVYFKLRRTN